MNCLIKPAITALLMVLAGNAQADIQEYSVTENFMDGTEKGATFKGTFDFDTDTQQLTNLHGVLKDANGRVHLDVDWYAFYGQLGGQAYDSNSTYELAVKDMISASDLFVGIVINNTDPTLDTFNSVYADNLDSKVLYGTELSASIQAVIPLPSACLLLASGLLGLGYAGRKNRYSA